MRELTPGAFDRKKDSMLSEPLNEWCAVAAVLTNLLGQVFIRWPHGQRSREIKVTEDRKGGLEIALLVLAMVGCVLLPVLWLTTSLFAWAEYGLYPVPFGLGVATMFLGLWLFHRAHVDLGRQFSVTLQLRDEHRLVTSGVYARIRHPMYTAIFLLALAQVLFLPNWFVGPSFLVGFGLLYVFRIRHEEALILDAFGDDYREYTRRTGRLWPRW